tara:strand:- start:171 stop:716 length:546 start_codon:yes stop_codon:yes gene_type:complete
MKEFPRFQMYRLFRAQSEICHLCTEEMNIHDLEVENIVEIDQENVLICYTCLEHKKKLISDYDEKDSLIDMDLRPMSNLMTSKKKDFNLNEFRFEGPIICTSDLSYVNEAQEQEEEEEDLDPEFKIQTSWYHRAMMFDDNREIYDDGLDTDFEAVEEYWNRKHEEESGEDEWQQNIQLCDV